MSKQTMQMVQSAIGDRRDPGTLLHICASPCHPARSNWMLCTRALALRGEKTGPTARHGLVAIFRSTPISLIVPNNLAHSGGESHSSIAASSSASRILECSFRPSYSKGMHPSIASQGPRLHSPAGHWSHASGAAGGMARRNHNPVHGGGNAKNQSL